MEQEDDQGGDDPQDSTGEDSEKEFKEGPRAAGASIRPNPTADQLKSNNFMLGIEVCYKFEPNFQSPKLAGGWRKGTIQLELSSRQAFKYEMSFGRAGAVPYSFILSNYFETHSTGYTRHMGHLSSKVGLVFNNSPPTY